MRWSTPRKVLCSIGAGPHAELLAVSEPTFRAYADRHGYEVRILSETPAPERPPAWGKVQLIRTLLADHDIVLWIDADAAVVDLSTDIYDDFKKFENAEMGLVAHTTGEADFPIPNTGVWIFKRTRRIRRFLGQVWESTSWLNHKWWENAAVLDLLGYDLSGGRLEVGTPTRMKDHTAFLPLEWNSIPPCPSPAPRIVHFPGLPLDERLALLVAATSASRREVQ
ncbi:MAG: hypothetical protein WAM97_10610 [Acidimicrobiales bacterium]